MKVLPRYFYTLAPDLARTTTDTKDFKELMMETQGEALINGKLYEIRGECIAPGVYKVTIQESQR